MSADLPRRIIVLGPMRSGTSLTAELIRRWGAYSGGEENLWKSDFGDRRGYGYMEYIPLQELNDELLEHNDRVPPSKEGMEEKAADPDLRRKAEGLLQKMDQEARQNNSDAWVWKDARIPLTLPFWAQLWGDPAFVVTVRHPADMALSSARTEGLHEEDFPFSAGFYQGTELCIFAMTSLRIIYSSSVGTTQIWVLEAGLLTRMALSVEIL